MKTFQVLLLAVVLALVATSPSFAQTTTTSTILTEALAAGSGNNRVTVASTTGMAVGGFIFMDREQARITAVNSSTLLTVNRGSNGVVTGHLDNNIVFYGTPGSYNPNTGNTTGVFIAAEPSGTCDSDGNQFLPVINPTSGNIWTCTSVNSIVNNSSSGSATGGSAEVQYWMAVNLNASAAMASVPYRTVENAAYSAVLADYFIDVNSITTARTITLPAVTGIYGNVKVVKHSGATAAITIAGASGQYVGTLGTLSTTISSGQSIRLISVGGGWATFGLD